MIDTILVEVANPSHPYGVRGVGEVPIVPPAGALANAIYHAVGVRLVHLPMSPAQILEALWAKQRACQETSSRSGSVGDRPEQEVIL
jgi:CO/xanthine dehydrogenase Mo-binding subunit